MPPIIAVIADQIAARRRVYDEALAADLRRLAKAHGDGPVQEALRLVGRQQHPTERWDHAGHQRAVREGVERTIAERRLADFDVAD
jgi:hypothetical protein